jgi:large subunit ribosomal protein L24
MATKEEIKRLSKPIKLKIRRGDKVMIISGKDRGEIGFVAAVSPKESKAIILKENVENPEQPIPLNRVIKHRKARMQGERSTRVMLPAPIHVSNLMLIDPDTNKPSRVGRRLEEGKMVRYSKKSGKTLPQVKPGQE